MKCNVQIPVNAAKEAVWKVISDIDNAVDTIDSITKIDILERPTQEGSLVGLKWTETRVMFGKETTETMWVTEAKLHEYYQTRTESCGAVYISRMYIAEKEHEDVDTGKNVSYVGMSFDGESQTFCSKVMMVLMGWMVVGETKKAILADLKNIKDKAESLEWNKH